MNRPTHLTQFKEAVMTLDEFKEYAKNNPIDKTVFLMVGNIGSGKSTLTKELVKIPNTYVCCLDSLRYAISAGNYVFDYYLETVIWSTNYHMYEGLLKQGHNIIVDECLMNGRRRRKYVQLARKFQYKIVGVEFPVLTQYEAVSRRMTNCHGDTSIATWQTVFDNFNKMYKPCSEKEVDMVIQLDRKDIGV